MVTRTRIYTEHVGYEYYFIPCEATEKAYAHLKKHR